MAYSPSTFLYLTVFTIVGYYILNAIRVKFTYYTGCKRPLNYPHKDPVLGLDLFLIYKKAFESGTFLETDRQLYKLYSKTFETNSFGTTLIKTIEPENAKVVYSTSFKNFGLQPLRYNTAENLFGNGIIVVDGPLWAHSRALIRTSFETVHITNINFLSPHVNRFMDLLPRDGSTVDLLPLLKRLILDTSSEFIFGDSVNSLSSTTPEESRSFLESFQYAQRGVGIRAMLGNFRFLHRDKKWWAACSTVTDFCDAHVEKALARLKLQKGEKGTVKPQVTDNNQGETTRLRLVDEMAKETQDLFTLRSQVLAVFSPAHENSAVTLGNAFFHLARYPEMWAKLRAEILPSKDKPLTFELLKSYKYLDHVLRETHRLTPIQSFNQRMCLKDTVLPKGGGPDGSSPMLIRKGEMIEINHRAMQRDKDFWGEDADEFQPDRWKTIRPTWEYTPFGGGPRTCPGLLLTYTETAYIAVRMLREFETLENRDEELEWKEEMRLSFQSKNGVKVGLTPAKL